MVRGRKDNSMRMRADQLLVSRGVFESRAKAQAAIEAGLVRVDGVPLRKASHMIADGAAIEAEAAHPYVSRGGVKLAAALDHFRISPKGRICLDIGASTGGFSDVMLRAGAKKIYAVDTGRDQLHPSLRKRKEIVSLERKDIRKLTREQIPGPDLVVIDVSFISLKQVLPKAGELATPRAELVALIKPQFEAGRKHLKKGIVRDLAIQCDVCEEVVAFAATLGWDVSGVIESPVLGGDGNREFLMAARRNRRT
jgi:23S rRNA (cytidine1920-2'-O)/16S rRNA (cytidine1409-2'-O)-methyltransferase